MHTVGARTYTRTACTISPQKIGLTKYPVQPEGGDVASISIHGLTSKQSRSRPRRMQTAVIPVYICMDDVATNLAWSLHNGGRLEVERAALYAVA